MVKRLYMEYDNNKVINYLIIIIFHVPCYLEESPQA